MRPEDPSDSDRIVAGVYKSMQQSGYDYPVRKLRRSAGVRCVTLPLQVRNFLALEAGDWLVFAQASWPGLAAFFKVTSERYRELPSAERKEFRSSARKVQAKSSALFVNIPKMVCEILSVKVGDFLYFGIAPQRSVVNICALKGGGDSAGSRRMG